MKTFLVNIIYFIGSCQNVSVFIPHCKRFHRVCKRFHQVNIIYFMGSSVWVDRTPTSPFRLVDPDPTPLSLYKQQQQGSTVFSLRSSSSNSGKAERGRSSSRSQATAQATLKQQRLYNNTPPLYIYYTIKARLCQEICSLILSKTF